MGAPHSPKRPWGLYFAGGLLLLLAIVVLSLPEDFSFTPARARFASMVTREASKAQVEQFCGDCHVTPPPESLPKSEWKDRVHNGYVFLDEFRHKPKYALPSEAAVLKYYEARAPEALPVVQPPDPREAAPPGRFGTAARFQMPRYPDQWVTNVNPVRLFHKSRQDVLVTDANHGLVMAFKPYAATEEGRWKALAKVPAPAHTAVADLDQDGIKDVLVACMGDIVPSDNKVGGVVWLKGASGGAFEPVTLLTGVGRVTDVQAADFDGDGDQDLIVAVFGWRTTGEIRFLENRTTDWSRPQFVSHVVDARPGAINVSIADLNGDGRPDFVALLAQHYETVEAFLNLGGGRFRRETVYGPQDPSLGSSGMQLADMDGDNDLDVLYTNGDVFDFFFLKPDNGVQWLENRGTFPFVRHSLAPFYGVHRAVAADMDGDKDQDVVAVSFLPEHRFPERGPRNLDSVIWLEQTSPGVFARRSVETASCDHPTCAVADLDGDGRMDIVAGNFQFVRRSPLQTLSVWNNLGPTRSRVSRRDP